MGSDRSWADHSDRSGSVGSGSADGLLIGELSPGNKWKYTTTPAKAISTVHVSRDGTVWIACDDSLCMLDEQRRIQPFHGTGTPPRSRVWSMTSSPGHLYLRTEDGVWRLDRKTREFSEIPGAGRINYLRALVTLDKSGNLITSSSTGMSIWRNNGPQ